jgi:hypothetical protein
MFQLPRTFGFILHSLFDYDMSEMNGLFICWIDDFKLVHDE